jgi:hypothetical protein
MAIHKASSSSENRSDAARLLQKALALAEEAVKLDSPNADPLGAFIAYGQSVAILNDVTERVRKVGTEPSTDEEDVDVTVQLEAADRLQLIVSRTES